MITSHQLANAILCFYPDVPVMVSTATEVSCILNFEMDRFGEDDDPVFVLITDPEEF